MTTDSFVTSELDDNDEGSQMPTEMPSVTEDIVDQLIQEAKELDSVVRNNHCYIQYVILQFV